MLNTTLLNLTGGDLVLVYFTCVAIKVVLTVVFGLIVAVIKSLLS